MAGNQSGTGWWDKAKDVAAWSGIIFSVASAAFTYLDFAEGSIPVYGKAVSTLLALTIIYFGSRRLWKRRARYTCNGEDL